MRFGNYWINHNINRPLKGRAPFGLFQNLSTDEEVKYIALHLFRGLVQITWSKRALLMFIMPFFFWTGIVDQVDGNIALVERDAGQYVEIDMSMFNCTPSEGDTVFIGSDSATCK
jgi:hypothetical protein